MIRPGAEWGEPAGPFLDAATPDLEVQGDDAALAAVVGHAPRGVVRFTPEPSSDLARAVGLTPTSATYTHVVPMDALAAHAGAAPPVTVVNMVVWGTPPTRLAPWSRSAPLRVHVNGRELFAGRATSVVVATGQFLEGADVVPRGHPGDGIFEVQVYALRAGERAPMRRRLQQGAHLPHPRIVTGRGHEVVMQATRGALPLQLDGTAHPSTATLTVAVVPAAYRLLL